MILEALLAATPVLVSDQTPWRDLEAAGAGWSLSLDEPEAFVSTIEALARTSVERRAEGRRAARAYAMDWLARCDGLAANRALLSLAAHPAAAA